MATPKKNVIKSYIILRHDTAEKWKKSNTVLKKGEIVLSIEDDGKQFLKTGDGERTWKDLPYIPVRAEDIVNLEVELEKSICISNLSNQVTQVSQKVDSVVSGSVTSEEKEKLESFTAQDVTVNADGTSGSGSFTVKTWSSDKSNAGFYKLKYGDKESRILQIVFTSDVIVKDKLVLRSPNGTYYTIKVSDDGVLSTEKYTKPVPTIGN